MMASDNPCLSIYARLCNLENTDIARYADNHILFSKEKQTAFHTIETLWEIPKQRMTLISF